MDISKYLNSKAVSEHLRKIKWECDPIEMACIIDAWRGPLKEKYAAWQSIIDEYPDKLIKSDHMKDGMGIQQFLSELTEIYKQKVAEFYDNTNAHYVVEYLFIDGSLATEPVHYSSCPISRDHKTNCSDLLDNLEKGDISSIEIKKYLPNQSAVMEANFNADLELMTIIGEGVYDYASVFRSRKFNIPVPFKKGDMVYDYSLERPAVYIGPANDNYILMRFVGDRLDEMWPVTGCLLGDFNGNEARTYVNRPNHKNKKKYETLLLISKYLKDQIDLSVLLNASYEL